MKKHIMSFRHAWAGIVLAFSTQENYKIHFILSILALLAGWFFKISYTELLITLTFIFLGLTFEMLNTAVEATCDAIDQTHREDIKIAKDVSAGAMLVFSFGAFITASIIFIPKIIVFFGH